MDPVAHYFDGFYPASGGVETHIRDIAKATDDPAILITDAVTGQPPTEYLRPGFLVKRVGPENSSFESRRRFVNSKPVFPLRVATDLLRMKRKLALLKRIRCRILQVHGLNMPGTLLRLGFQRFPQLLKGIATNFDQLNVPKIATVHGLLSRTGGGGWEHLEREFYRGFDHLLCVDRSLMRFIEGNWSDVSGDACLHWCPNGVDTDFFRYSEPPLAPPLRIGFLGRLEYSRGLDQLIFLSRHLPPGVELVVIGAGSFNEIRRFESLAGRRQVRCSYNMDAKRVFDSLRSIHVLFNPVPVDGISRASLEALAVGRPVAMFVGHDRYPVLQGRTGFLLERSQPAILEWANSLTEMGDLLEKMGVEGRKLTESEFSLEKFGNRLRDIYAHVERRLG